MKPKISAHWDSVTAFFRKEKLVIMVAAPLFVLVWALNHYYPISIDDWCYAFGVHDGEPINSFLDILKSQYRHYFAWGGRSVGHTVAQTLLWLGEGWGDWLNTMAFISFVLVIYVIANKHTGKSQPSVLVAIFLLIWFIQRHYLNECVFWFTGSGNYLWCCLIMLLFLAPICSYYFLPADKKHPVVWSIAFFVAGIIAGWTNENMSVGLVFFMAVMFVLLKYENKKIPLWAMSGSIGLVIGCVLLLAAPGNYVRFNEVDAHYTPFRFTELLRIVKEFLKFGVLASVAYLLVLACFVRLKKQSDKNSQVLRLSLLFFCTAIFAWLVMLASPKFPPRAWFGITSFAIVAIVLLYAHIDKKTPVVGKLNIGALTAGCILFAVTYVLSLNETIRIRKIFDEREQYIREQRELGNRDITFRESFVSNPSPLVILPHMFDLSTRASSWLNEAYSKYHGIDSVRVVKLPEKETSAK